MVNRLRGIRVRKPVAIFSKQNGGLGKAEPDARVLAPERLADEVRGRRSNC
jgi:hypothetical protein